MGMKFVRLPVRNEAETNQQSALWEVWVELQFY